MIQFLGRTGIRTLTGTIDTPRIISLLKVDDFSVVDLRDGRMLVLRWENYKERKFYNQPATIMLRQTYPKLLGKVYGEAIVFDLKDMTPLEQQGLREIEDGSIQVPIG